MKKRLSHIRQSSLLFFLGMSVIFSQTSCTGVPANAFVQQQIGGGNSTGSSGSTGNSGTAGTSGSSASAGSSGTSATAGTAGTSNTAGTTGSSAGSDGSAGANAGGSSGGSAGTSGDTGTSGTSGNAGTSGTAGVVSSTNISALSDLPLITGPVVASAAADLSALTLGIGTTSATVAGKSYAHCKMINTLRQTFDVMANSDYTLCMIKEVLASNTSIYDGAYHIFKITNPDTGVPDRFRIKVIRDSQNKLTSSEIETCKNDVQDLYLSNSVSNTMFTTVAKGIARDTITGSSIDISTSSQGTLNDDLQYTGSKTISMSYLNTFPDTTTTYGNVLLTQTDDLLTYDGYLKNMGVNITSLSTYAVMAYSDADSSDTQYHNLSDLTINAGAATMDVFSTTDFSVEQGWNIQGQRDSSSVYLTETASHPAPEIGSAPNISFSGSQSYDCSGTPDLTMTVNLQSIESACSGLILNLPVIDCESVAPVQ